MTSAGILTLIKKYSIYPVDAALLSAPFWDEVDHIFKIVSFSMGVVVFAIAVIRWIYEKRNIELKRKSLELENQLKENQLAEQMLRNKELLNRLIDGSNKPQQNKD